MHDISMNQEIHSIFLVHNSVFQFQQNYIVQIVVSPLRNSFDRIFTNCNDLNLEASIVLSNIAACSFNII